MLGLPKTTDFNKRIPKEKFYENLNVTPTLKKSFVEQIGNPYCYTDGELVIGIGYAETEMSLNDKLAIYACGLG